VRGGLVHALKAAAAAGPRPPGRPAAQGAGRHSGSCPAADEPIVGSERSDELLGHHGSDVLSGRGRSDILWGDRDGVGQPTSQHDVIYGGGGDDFIYGSHGYNTIYGGPGNDAISVHYGRGVVDCGPGRDVYHVARSRKRFYRFINCEKVDYRSERQRGGGLQPLP
jgi:Ca2+-binding RTX toxin-like protein